MLSPLVFSSYVFRHAVKDSPANTNCDMGPLTCAQKRENVYFSKDTTIHPCTQAKMSVSYPDSLPTLAPSDTSVS